MFLSIAPGYNYQYCDDCESPYDSQSRRPFTDVSDISKRGMTGRILTNVDIWKCGVELGRRLGSIHLSKRDYFLFCEVVLAWLGIHSMTHVRPANKHSSKRRRN